LTGEERQKFLELRKKEVEEEKQEYDKNKPS
jgi:hypothetical protein